jgi:hypothetical protein
MATLTLRIPKGSPLTNAEIDDNFIQLDQTKIQLGGDIGGSTSSPTVISLRGRTLSSAVPTTGQAIVWNGSIWIPQTVSVGEGGGTGTSTVTSIVTLVISSTTTTYPAFGAYPDSGIQQTITSGSQQKVLFQNEEFDLLWSEGAIYNIGFERGLREWISNVDINIFNKNNYFSTQYSIACIILMGAAMLPADATLFYK